MYEENFLNKIVRNMFLGIGLSATILLGMGAKKVADAVKPVFEAATPVIEQDDKDKFLIYGDGIMRTLPVGKDGVNVLVNNSFSKEQKQAIAEAIAELDDYLLNVDYNIYLDPSQAPDRCITFEEVDFPGTHTGEATTTCIKNYPYFLYPIKISIDADKVTEQNGELNVELFKAVVKHEMLHTLGLADIYDEQYKTKTIMYHTFNSETPTDLTQADIDLLNSVYTSKYVNSGLFASTNVGRPLLIEFAHKKETDLQDDMVM